MPEVQRTYLGQQRGVKRRSVKEAKGRQVRSCREMRNAKANIMKVSS